MNELLKYTAYILGIIALLYLAFRYIIPFLFKFLAGTIGIFFKILLIAAVLAGIVWTIGYISKSSKKQN